MRFNLSSGVWTASVAVAYCLLAFTMSAAQKELKFEAWLVWAANADKSPVPGQKPVNSEVRKKINELPLKWKNYFVVTNVNFSVSIGSSKKVALSEKCELVVKDIDGQNIEVALIGKGRPVLKRTQGLPKPDMLVLGGNAPEDTGWLVVLKRVD